ncbi:hypothetical protein [Pedobacter sp. UBA5917]|jgi:hypothetical protein|uniref:hypothetical protein n=1 Tax=Pedobacter sp. UBA5917 TaxID=1947061 RepID=UPI0025E7C300|nr:hypothetical protein [Pedobacter sp. UBA5917]
MQTNSFEGLDLKKEIGDKRLSPEYVYDYLEANFHAITKTYNSRKKVYKSNINASKKDFSKTLDYFDEGITAAAKSSKILKEAVKNFNSPRYFEILATANDPLVEFDKIEFDVSKWSRESMENFDRLHTEWTVLQNQSDHARKALIFLIKGKTLKTVSSGFVFSLSFFTSYYLGTYLEGRFAFMGEFWAKLLTAFLFFIVVDWLLDKVKTKLIWTRINILYQELEELRAVDGLQQAIVDNNEAR